MTFRCPRPSTLVASLACLAFACRKPAPVERETPPAASASSAPAPGALASPSLSVGPPARRADVPTYVIEPFAPGEEGLHITAVDGAIAAWTRGRVGRVQGEGIEWLAWRPVARRPDSNTPEIWDVYGAWPDALYVKASWPFGPAMVNELIPIAGKGESRSIGMSGVPSWYCGVATVGGTTLACTAEHRGPGEIGVLRGPPLRRKLTRLSEVKCKAPEYESRRDDENALIPGDMAASRGGTLVVAGRLCSTIPALEIWDKPDRMAPSRVVELTPWVDEKVSGELSLLAGLDDELWVVLPRGAKAPVLRYKGRELAPLPAPSRASSSYFVSSEGKLHAFDGQTFHRYDEGWRPIGRLSMPYPLGDLVLDSGTFWGTQGGKIARLREGRGFDFREGCPTPFVYLYDVSTSVAGASDGKPDPAALLDLRTASAFAAALSKSDGGQGLGMVEFTEARRRVGVKVESQRQGEAVVARLSSLLPEQRPQLLCYEPAASKAVDFVDREGCSTPFVYLYDVDGRSPASFAFPVTQRALSSFEGASDLTLVDFRDGGRRLGVKVKSREQASALIEHLATTMKDERPVALCYEPSNGRSVPIKPR